MKEGPRSALAVRPISAPAAKGAMTVAVPTVSSQATVPGRVGLIDRFSVVLVALAETMWGADRYFRAQLIGHLKPAQIVVIEDALVSLFLLAFLLRGIPEFRRLDKRGWLAIGLIAVGPQAIATLLFTKSFSYGHFAETFVLQQTQPLIAILLAWLVLGERRRPSGSPSRSLCRSSAALASFSPCPTSCPTPMLHPRRSSWSSPLGPG